MVVGLSVRDDDCMMTYNNATRLSDDDMHDEALVVEDIFLIRRRIVATTCPVSARMCATHNKEHSAWTRKNIACASCV